mmetsp:Transcript_18781/g.30129  ORF Transcript_18781/g.30129 Transcript_18781/m.30129 type:complete len:310 (-) Transcript_18781:71-1000(-)
MSASLCSRSMFRACLTTGRSSLSCCVRFRFGTRQPPTPSTAPAFSAGRPHRSFSEPCGDAAHGTNTTHTYPGSPDASSPSTTPSKARTSGSQCLTPLPFLGSPFLEGGSGDNPAAMRCSRISITSLAFLRARYAMSRFRLRVRLAWSLAAAVAAARAPASATAAALMRRSISSLSSSWPAPQLFMRTSRTSLQSHRSPSPMSLATRDGMRRHLPHVGASQHTHASLAAPTPSTEASIGECASESHAASTRCSSDRLSGGSMDTCRGCCCSKMLPAAPVAIVRMSPVAPAGTSSSSSSPAPSFRLRVRLA